MTILFLLGLLFVRSCVCQASCHMCISIYLSMNLRVVKEQLKDFQDVDDIFSPDDIVV